MHIISKSIKETKTLAQKIASQLKRGEVICLFGDLGAGKTVFATSVINHFLPQKRVLSPTFIIVRHYPIDHNKIKCLYHLDLYRISDKKEVDSLGLSEFFNDSNCVVIIEWADKIKEQLPKKRIDVFLSISKNKNEREITIKKHG